MQNKREFDEITHYCQCVTFLKDIKVRTTEVVRWLIVGVYYFVPDLLGAEAPTRVAPVTSTRAHGRNHQSFGSGRYLNPSHTNRTQTYCFGTMDTGYTTDDDVEKERDAPWYSRVSVISRLCKLPLKLDR